MKTGMPRDRGGFKEGHVLIVDDEPSICRALEIALARAGLNATVAESGDVALTKLRTEQFDAMICDLRMPDMRGDVLFELAAAIQPQLRQRTLFTTGDITDRAERLIGACKCPMLRKPFELADVVETVRALLPQTRGESSA
jgi:DNA-binding NtrC family response regulator